MNIDNFWQAFLEKEGLPKATEYYDAFCFDQENEDEPLLKLVLSGQKRATCSAAESFEKYCLRLPEVGDYSIVFDRRGDPKCIFKTVEIHKMLFNEMTWDLCRQEGEDEELSGWVKNHTKFFSWEAAKLGYTFHSDMPIVFEIFEIVFAESDI